MAHDAYLLFNSAPSNGGCPIPQGESLIDQTGGAISLGDSWGFSLENKLDISSVTTGAGSGKAEFQEFNIKKQVDTASPTLFLACGCGASFNNVQLILRKATGDTIQQSTRTYLIWTFNMFVVEKIEWAYGDPAPEETVTFKFGACQIQYYQQNPDGTLQKTDPQMWSQVTASSSMNVGGGMSGAIGGALDAMGMGSAGNAVAAAGAMAGKFGL
jgi:type VI secretion system secreted protein Hcp